MTVKCPGCNKNYENGKGFSIHQRHCRELGIMIKTRFKMRQENAKKKLGVNLKLAHQSKKARDEFRECTNSFQPDLDTHTGGKRKLSVRWFEFLF
jgi:hypothetical protein